MNKTVISSDQAKHFSIPGESRGFVYDLGVTQSIAVVETNGRYPEKGCSMNDVCTETVFLLEGFLNVEIDGKQNRLEKFGDVFVISPGSKYSIAGNGKAIDFITPAWDKSQNHIIES